MQSDQNKDGYNRLSLEEEAVIVHKGTERPFTGKYNKNKEQGSYVCKRCDAKLFHSGDKFDSNCGWPSFDDSVPEAVELRADEDGVRTEIVCKNCQGHLGHVFTGEGFTEKNARHCVNSISLNFLPAETDKSLKAAYFAGGCFWGVEHFFQNAKGVVSTRVGYMGGDKSNPTYKDVCSGTTGHAETLKVVYDPSLTSFEALAKLFFETHDPTQRNRQGPDVGDQYRSAVFYTDDKQKETAQKLVAILKETGIEPATEITQADKFWPAEEYHQLYYKKNGKKPYCHTYQKRFYSD